MAKKFDLSEMFSIYDQASDNLGDIYSIEMAGNRLDQNPASGMKALQDFLEKGISDGKEDSA